MRERNSARERAEAAQTEPRGFPALVPSPLGQCSVCGRWVGRALLCVMPVGEPAVCGLCMGVAELQRSIVLATLTPIQEEAVMATLRFAHRLIRQPDGFGHFSVN